MNSKLVMVMVIALLSGACNQSVVRSVEFDSTVPEDHQALFMYAMGEWNDKLSREHGITLVLGKGDIVVNEVSGSVLGHGHSGMAYWGSRSTISLYKDLGLDWNFYTEKFTPAMAYTNVSMHELGHILSERNDHIEKGNVMYSGLSEVIELTQADVDYVTK